MDLNSRTALLGVIVLCVSTKTLANDFDVLGVKLGMTVAEVKNVLTGDGVDADIKEHRQHYTYSDGVVHGLKTEDFIYYIDAIRTAENTDNLSIFFSPGPLGGRVVAVTRAVTNQTNPPTRSQYVNALTEKYGEPTSADISTLQWDFPAEKNQCIAGSVGSYMPAQPSILKKIYSSDVGSRDAA
jgi:hypothetical protein